MDLYSAVASWVGWPAVVAILLILGAYGGWILKNRVDFLNQELGRTNKGSKPIKHYLLFWERGPDDWAEADWIAAQKYIGRFQPVCGFSRYEAGYAEMVTIVGASGDARGGVDEGAERYLAAAGCKWERLDGKTFDETATLFEERLRQNVAFKGGIHRRGY